MLQGIMDLVYIVVCAASQSSYFSAERIASQPSSNNKPLYLMPVLILLLLDAC